MVEDLFWDEFALLASPVLYFAQGSVIFELASIRRPVGLMDKASASGAGDSRFESWAGHCCLRWMTLITRCSHQRAFEQAHFWQAWKTFNVDEGLGQVESAPTGD